MRFLRLFWLILLLINISCSKNDNAVTTAKPTSTTPSIAPPRNMIYQESGLQKGIFNFQNQIEITTEIYPQYYGSEATSFSISPALPTGLQFSEISGRIAGTPEALDPVGKNYTIRATNQYGFTESQITISIKAQPPFGLRYITDNMFLEKDKSTINVPSSNEGIRGGAKILSYTINPQLPVGLTFDTATGTIEGTPTVSSSLTTYTIVGSNSGGTTSTSLNIIVSNTIQSMALGAQHSCVLINGKVKCWGDNTFGQLGDGTNNSSLNIAKTVLNLPIIEMSTNDVLFSGSDYSCTIADAAFNTAKAYCWGRNNSGQLPSLSGNKNSATLSISTGVQFLTLSKYGSSNFANTCYKTKLGTPYCYGSFPNGNLNSINNEVRNELNSQITSMMSMVSGGSFFCGIDDSDKKIKCLGDNSLGQLGDNQTSGSGSLISTIVSGLSGTDYNFLKAGKDFACAVGSSDLKCWGDNTFGQLGSPAVSQNKSLIPVSVVGLSSLPAGDKVVLGKSHACAIVGPDKKVQCWGSNNYGQLGRGTVTANGSNIPMNVVKDGAVELTDVQSLYVGDDHTCAKIMGLNSIGNEIYCWGLNSAGQLGDGTTNNSGIAKKITISLD